MNNQTIDRDSFFSISNAILDSENHIGLDSAGYSMFPLLKPGDKLIIQKVEAHKLRKGDIIVCTINAKTIGHRIIGYSKNISSFTVITQGDN